MDTKNERYAIVRSSWPAYTVPQTRRLCNTNTHWTQKEEKRDGNQFDIDDLRRGGEECSERGGRGSGATAVRRDLPDVVVRSLFPSDHRVRRLAGCAAGAACGAGVRTARAGRRAEHPAGIPREDRRVD